jgi:hypothetical protein
MKAAESLKLYRRADLQNPEKGTDLTEKLYVDPLPHDQVLQTVMRSNTTFLIGRGTRIRVTSRGVLPK